MTGYNHRRVFVEVQIVVEIFIAYEGKLRCRATHGPSGKELITDAPKDNMGEGASFSPTDLVATALGTCMLTIMAIVADRERIDLSAVKVKVVKEMIQQPERRIGKLTVEFDLPVRVTDEQRIKLERAAMTCPVHKSLLEDVEIPVKFNWSQPVSA